MSTHVHVLQETPSLSSDDVSAPSLVQNDAARYVHDSVQLGLVLRLTLLLLLLHGASGASMQGALVILTGSMLLLPSWLFSHQLWWLLAIALVFGNASRWMLIDNHKYLITYWTIGCALAVSGYMNPGALAKLARLLIVCVFSLAVVWKIAAQQYIDGSFIYFTMLTDARLTSVRSLVLGADAADVGWLRPTLAALAAYNASDATVPLAVNTSVKVLARLASWGTLALECAVAVAFAVSSTSKVRHYLLMAFCAITYALLPVLGFAVVLIVLGLSQCRPEDRVVVRAYLLVLAGVHVSMLPWQAALVQAVQ